MPDDEEFHLEPEPEVDAKGKKKPFGLFKNGYGHYSYRFRTVHGVRTVNLGTGNSKEANKRIKAARLREMEVNRIQRDVLHKMISGERVDNHVAVDRWLASLSREGNTAPSTLKKYGYSLRAFLTTLKLNHTSPAAITEEHVNKWINGASAGKLNTRMFRHAVLRAYLTFCEHKSYAFGNPARVLRSVNLNNMSHDAKETAHRMPFTDAEIRDILEFIEVEIARAGAELVLLRERYGFNTETSTLPVVKDWKTRIESLKFWRVAIPIGRWTGLRLGDIVGLEWATMSKPGVLSVWTEKRGSRVELPINEPLAKALASIPRVNETYCFPKQRLAHKAPGALLSVQFNKLMKQCGIEDRCFHSTRSAAAVDMHQRMMAAGYGDEAATEVVREILGHAHASVTKESYLHTLKKPACVLTLPVVSAPV